MATDQSLDDIFASGKTIPVQPTRAQQGGGPQNLEDIFSKQSAGAGSLAPPQASGEGMNEIGRAMAGGFNRGLTLGYSDRYSPPEIVQAEKDHPVVSGISDFAGSMGPGFAVNKLAKGLSFLPKLGFLSEPGIRTGAVEGSALGGASDPGENGSRLENAGWGGALGSIISRFARSLGGAGETMDVVDKLHGDEGNYSKDVASQGADAIKNLMNREVTPRQGALAAKLNGQEVEVDPNAISKLWERRTDPTRPRLDPIESIIKAQGVNPYQTNLSADDAQKLKGYFDSRSGYRDPRGVNPQNVASDQSAKRVADYLRGKLAEIPGVGELNEGMESAMKLKRDLQDPLARSPIGTVSSSAPDRVQQLMDLDSKAGSNLAGTGEKIRDAKDLGRFSWDDLFKVRNLTQPLHFFHTLGEAADTAGGRFDQMVGRKFPNGTNEAIMNAARDRLKNKDSGAQK